MASQSDLTGKAVVVTGATGGLGVSVVAALLERGATVHLPVLDETPPTGLPWSGNPRVKMTPAVRSDDELAITRFFEGISPLWASIHLVGGFKMAPIGDTSAADVERMFRLNTLTCFLACREAVRAIRKSGDGGRIVNVAARPAVAPVGGMIAYSISKAAVASLTQSLAAEVLADRISVNAIVPSTIDTPANRASMPTADFAKWPKPTELAETIAFLVSPACSATSGSLVPVYGSA
jgi:NAD(P)-dependent dehydrogenase (short-subunit alcohol dehydrogenase family)